MLRYRLVRAIHGGYPLAVLWLYVGVFLIAMMLMFVMPPLTLVLFGLGLAGLVPARVGAALLGLLERFVARIILDGGACPACGHRMQTRRDETTVWRCDACGRVFAASGAATPDQP